jgi:hypothetical protein
VKSEGPDAKPNQPRGEGSRWLVETEATAGGAALGYAIGGVEGAMVGAVAPNFAGLAFRQLAAWRVRHVNQVIEDAAAEAQMTPEELIARLMQSELHGELAARILIAAQDAGTAERLRGLSRSLAKGALAVDTAEITTELLYARALADLDAPHIRTLSLFAKTWAQLGLSTDDTLPPDGLNYTQLQMCAALGQALDPVLGVLLRHGLLDERQAELSEFAAGPVPRGQIRLTEFGRDLIDRRELLGRVDLGIVTVRDTTPTATDGCLVCGAAVTHQPIPSRNSIAIADPDDPTRVTYQHLPRMPVCDVHVQSLITGHLAVGWCESCQRWGQASTECQCGKQYVRFR